MQLYDFAIRGEIRQRCDTCPANGLGGAIGGGSVVKGLIVQHTKVGMWLDGPFSDLVISGNIISDTAADGINLHAAVTNVTVHDNHIRNTGDDGIAEWSQNNCDGCTHPNAGNTIAFNTVECPVLANCIALYGGMDHTVTDNILADPISSGGALHVGNRFTSYPLAGHSLLARNSLYRGGCLDPNWKFGVGALWFYALEEVQDGNVAVRDTDVFDSPYEAVQFIGKGVANVAFFNVSSRNVGSFFLQIQTNVDASFQDVTAVGDGYAGVYNCEPASSVNLTLVGDGNAGWTNHSTCGFPPHTSDHASMVN